MDFYIATRFENWKTAKDIAAALRRCGEGVICPWWEVAERLESEPAKLAGYQRVQLNRSSAILDVQGVKDCGALIHVYTPENRGAWGEHVAALALGRQVLFFATDEEMPDLWNVFSFHPLCQRVCYQPGFSAAGDIASFASRFVESPNFPTGPLHVRDLA